MPLKKYDSKFDAFSKKEGEEAKIDDGNRLCEKIFQKRANVSNEGALPRNFWNLPKYKGSYTGQVIAANRLLQKYSMIAISKAIDSPEAKYVLSYTNKKLIPIIEKYEKLTEQEFVPTEVETSGTRKPFGKKNLWSEL
jgi:hypothetical protein|tara:strand:+ start:301 stop:714 length:414 start_codon:yes stop_codon:yes gene_type:complete